MQTLPCNVILHQTNYNLKGIKNLAIPMTYRLLWVVVEVCRLIKCRNGLFTKTHTTYVACCVGVRLLWHEVENCGMPKHHNY